MTHLSPITLTAEQVHVVMIAGQYLLAPLAYWGGKHIVKDLRRTMMERVESIADDKAMSRSNEVRTEISGKLDELAEDFRQHVIDDEKNFDKIDRKLDIVLSRGGA